MFDNAEVVADHQIGQAELVLQIQQKVDDLRPDRNVQCRDGFVQHHDFRSQNQRAGNADALALAARKLMRKAPPLFGRQANAFQHRRDAILDLGFRGDTMQPQGRGQ